MSMHHIRNYVISFHIFSEIEKHSLSLFNLFFGCVCIYAVCNVKGIVTVNEGIKENEAVGKAIIYDFWERHRASIQLLFCGWS